MRNQAPLKSATLDKMDEIMQRMHMAHSTRKTYLWHVQEFIRWTKYQFGVYTNPKELGRDGLRDFLTYLAVERDVAASTQNGALQAALFMFKHVHDMDIQGVNALRAIRGIRIPTVLSVNETVAILRELQGMARLIAMLLYGAGLRTGEAHTLRFKDVDFERKNMILRAAKGNKDRVVQLPVMAVEPLQRQMAYARKMHEWDVKNGTNRVELPHRLRVKYPKAEGSLEWYWVFPSHKTSRHPDEGWLGRFHVSEDNFTRSLGIAKRKCGILKRVTSHVFRHGFATHGYEQGIKLLSLRDLMGHAHVETTEIYINLSKDGATSETSPLDRLPKIA